MIRFRTHDTELTEAFNRPYSYRLKKVNKSFYIGEFKLPDGGEVTVYFEGMEWSDVEMSWGVKFQRTNPKRPHASLGETGEGDAMRIFATVIEIIKEFTKKEKPMEVGFSAHKPEWMVDTTDKKDASKASSREKLYQKLIKRYAGSMGYKYSSTSSNTGTDYSLVPK